VNFEFFIVKKSIAGRSGQKSGNNSLVTISMVAIALSVAVMILSVTILSGFKKEIKEKLTGFGGHIQISRLDANNSYESEPIPGDMPFLQDVRRLQGVTGLYPFITKPAIIQAGTELQGIVLKGIDSSFSWKFFENNLVSGKLPDVADFSSNEVMISESLSRLLKVTAGQKLTVYFIQDPPRLPRKLLVTGTYRTGLEEYDKLFVYCGIEALREVTGWDPGMVSGFGINLSNSDRMDALSDQVRLLSAESVRDSGELLEVQTLKELAPGFFDFLSLTDTNVWIILTLMGLIAGFNMISGLLIIILDRTRMIGILKALGTANRSITRIFLYQGLYIIGKGLILGNIIGLTLAIIQDRLQVIPLNPENYFVNAVPIHLNIIHLILLNAGTVAVTLVMMLVPAGILTRISPDKTIKFD
jgi:lipoprotein-releasing system permease protein